MCVRVRTSACECVIVHVCISKYVHVRACACVCAAEENIAVNVFDPETRGKLEEQVLDWLGMLRL